MGIPLRQAITIGAYVLGQHLRGPQALSAGADARAAVPLQSRLRRLRQDRLSRPDPRSAPVGRRLPGGGRRMRRAGGRDRRRRAAPAPGASRDRASASSPKQIRHLCTNALLLEKKIDQYQAAPPISTGRCISTATRRCTTGRSARTGVYDRAVEAIRAAKAKGFRVNINCTLFNDAEPERVAELLRRVMELGVDGITVSPGYAYERAPDQQHFLNRAKTKELFRDIFRRARGRRKWSFIQSGLFLDFLAGNQTYHCTPWGNPTPHCVRLAAALLSARRRLCQDLQGADGRDRLGCATAPAITRNAPTAWCIAATRRPPSSMRSRSRGRLRRSRLAGIKTDGPMAPEIPLDRQRPAEYVFSRHVEQKLAEIAEAEAGAEQVVAAE